MRLGFLEFCSHGGTSKNTKIAQNLTPSYRFCDGMVFTNIVAEVMCAPENKNAKNPVFLMSEMKGVVVAS